MDMVSKQPRKQRKEHFAAPLHKRQKKVAAPLSKELRKTYKRRSAIVRVGDKVKILRGDFKGRTGEVTKVSLKNYAVHVKGVTVKKANGEEVPKPIHPSNLMIIELKLDDEKRKKKFAKEEK
ncbi:MAG: 50S ribosomal protein L24 [Candidatus Diapherotrites archaeon]|nr:50S ribosomal protein L24 [Candidatus Diapherotrites archaeon]